MSGAGPAAHVLGRLLLLQSTLQAASGEAHAAEMALRVLQDIPGVGGVAIELFDDTGATWSIGAGAESAPDRVVRAEARRFPIRTLRLDCGELRLEIGDASAFAPYEGFVANAANDLASHVEARRTAARIALLNRALGADLEDRSRLYRLLFDEMAEGVIILDARQRVLEINRAGVALLGIAAERLVGNVPTPSLLGFVAADGIPLARERFPSYRCLADRRAVLGEVIGVRHPGRDDTQWLSVNAIPRFEAGAGLPSGVFVSFRDITEARRAQAELRIAATAFDSQDGMVITDPAGTILRVNAAFTRITGYAAAEAIGGTPRILRSGAQDSCFYARMWQALLSDGRWSGVLRNRRKDATLYTERLTISAVRDAEGAVSHYVGTMSDISAEVEAREHVEHLRHFDVLTELPNRSLLEDRIGHALQASARSGALGAVAMVDLDHFKQINETLGHAIGDSLLVEAARRLRDLVRDSDTVGRFSGDGFIVLIEGLGTQSGDAERAAAVLAEKVRAGFGAPLVIDGRAISCSVSIGVTMLEGAVDTVDVLLKEVEIAMYRAKDAGRDTLRMFESQMQRDLDARALLRGEMRAAVARSEFVVHYQLQVDRGGAPIGAEALLRWQHPVHGLLGPGHFIAEAEASGLIDAIGHWVLEQGCRQIVRWEEFVATRALSIAVNVSAHQFRRADFVPEVVRLVAATGAKPERLKLEITESLALEDIADSVLKLQQLRAAGIRISLDDFGTGNSSLAYLTSLPLDQLKIDRSFVVDLPQDRRAAQIVQAIIAMGKGLELQVIAEGVETPEQAAFLDRLGCDAFQGFLFARPVSAAEVEARVNGER